jgi:DNA (cytosine-5)-methyltransferase 1
MRAIDLFAGFGGFSLGAEMAGAELVWAANHNELAVSVHAAAHPNAIHVCQDLRQADWTQIPSGVDLVLAGPACQGHSSASQPKRRAYHDAMRATAWAVVDCVEVVKPAAVIVENVPAFARWALFDTWRQALRVLGYTVTVRKALASHHGVPQRRTRLFTIGVRNGARVELRKRNEPAFGDCIDWSADRPWKPFGRAPAATRIRLDAAVANHGPRCLSQHTTGHQGVSLREPIRTITTKDHWLLVDGDRYRPLTLRELARGMGFPDSFALPMNVARTDVIRGLGNAVPPPLARDVVAAVMSACREQAVAA